MAFIDCQAFFNNLSSIRRLDYHNRRLGFLSCLCFILSMSFLHLIMYINLTRANKEREETTVWMELLEHQDFLESLVRKG